MKNNRFLLALVVLAASVSALPGSGQTSSPAIHWPGGQSFSLSPETPPDLWTFARYEDQVHRFSTLFTAQDVRDYLSDEDGLRQAIAWCKKTGITKVYLEAYRDAYRAERATLENAKRQFTAAGFEVSGCVTTTKIGKPSTGWKDAASCYTDLPTQDKLQAIFEYAASLFDEIMIDDFWFTDCACPVCDAARRARTVTVGDRTYPVAGDSWAAYRCELMLRLSQDRLLAPAKRVNPRARLIIKYPQWYDDFHQRGYDVTRETADFDRIWVGTETRDYGDHRWGGTVQYEGFFLMRWLGGIGGDKCGGGWFDSFGTTPSNYVEQTRQTILGGARETMLFSYGSLQKGSGPNDVEALRDRISELLFVARDVRLRRLIGLAAYKPPNSPPGGESRVFDFLGMLGFPLVPCHEFPTNAPAAFFSLHALKDADFPSKLNAYIRTGKPVLLTDGLAQTLTNGVKLDTANVHILPVKGSPKSLLQLGETELDALRAPLLRPLKFSLLAPTGIALYPFADGSCVIENFTDENVRIQLNGGPMPVPARGWLYHWDWKGSPPAW